MPLQSIYVRLVCGECPDQAKDHAANANAGNAENVQGPGSRPHSGSCNFAAYWPETCSGTAPAPPPSPSFATPDDSPLRKKSLTTTNNPAPAFCNRNSRRPEKHLILADRESQEIEYTRSLVAPTIRDRGVVTALSMSLSNVHLQANVSPLELN